MTKDHHSDQSRVELARFGTVSSPLIVSINIFEGRRYLDIRRFYLEKKSNELKPTPKGISLKEDEFEEVSRFLLSHTEAIRSGFVTSLTADEIGPRSTRREEVARRKLNDAETAIETKFESSPNPNFFRCEFDSDKTTIVFNRRNKFMDENKLNSRDPLEVLTVLVSGYVKAKQGLQFDKKVDAKTVTDFLELNWGQGLR